MIDCAHQSFDSQFYEALDSFLNQAQPFRLQNKFKYIPIFSINSIYLDYKNNLFDFSKLIDKLYDKKFLEQ